MPSSIDHRRAWGKLNKLIVFTSSSAFALFGAPLFLPCLEGKKEVRSFKTPRNFQSTSKSLV
jgi:hypothetical protein